LISGGVLILSIYCGLSFSCSSELLLALFCHFAWLCCFLCRLQTFAVFLLLDNHLKFFDFLGLLAVLHGILDSNVKLCAFVVNGLIKGKIKKSSGQFIGLIVTSH
jgi:hypothetical protein